MKYLITIAFMTLAISCNNQPNSKLILGSWTDTDTTKQIEHKITFFPDNSALYYNLSDSTSAPDSIKYRFNKEENRLLTSEATGKTYDLEIFRLTKNELVLIRKKDTLRLQKK